jgi:cell division septum initiation protein DivIVA
MVVLLVSAQLVSFHGQYSAMADETQSLEQRVKELEKEVAELQDTNGMLMENLMNCVEENKELSQGSEQEAGKTRAEGIADPNLVDRLEELLQSDADLGFMLKLNQEELELILELVQKRLASP